MKAKHDHSTQKIAKHHPTKKAPGETSAELEAELQAAILAMTAEEPAIEESATEEQAAEELTTGLGLTLDVAEETGAPASQPEQPIYLALGEGMLAAADTGTQGLGTASATTISAAIPEGSATVAHGAAAQGTAGAAAAVGSGISWGWIGGGAFVLGAAAGGGGGGGGAVARIDALEIYALEPSE